MKQVLEAEAGLAVLEGHAPRDVLAGWLSEAVQEVRANPVHPIEPGVLVRQPEFLARYFVLAADERTPERLTAFDRPVLLALAAGGPCRLVTARADAASGDDPLRARAESLRPGAYRRIATGTLFRLEPQAESLLLFVSGRARAGASVIEADGTGRVIARNDAADRNVRRLYLLALAGRLGGDGLRAEVAAFSEHDDAETRFVAARSLAALDTMGAPHGV